MIATVERPEMRISVRVEPDLYERVEQIAKRKYEGRFSMAAREAFRLLIASNDESEQEREAVPA